jgi:putative nucleotidyltransferase with HDIG domain
MLHHSIYFPHGGNHLAMVNFIGFTQTSLARFHHQNEISIPVVYLILAGLVILITHLILLLLVALQINQRQRLEAELKLINAELDHRVKLRTQDLEKASAELSELVHTRQELAQAYEQTLEGWSRMLELRGEEAEGHTYQVTEVALELARSLGLGEEELLHIRRGAMLHDIGKIGIPDTVLQKPDRLTKEEWEIVRLHPRYAYDLLSPISYLGPTIDIPYCHHERWDGTGYPRGLAGEQIPLAARIFSVVDVWDSMGSDRPYRERLPQGVIVAYIQTQIGKQFDPLVVEHFLALLEKKVL